MNCSTNSVKVMYDNYTYSMLHTFPNLTIFMLFFGLSIRTIIKIQQGKRFSIPYQVKEV
ncbi:UNVERIFIED_CONTAM: hypothetical protein NCL1_61457 [Trichonephila clavipes]